MAESKKTAKALRVGVIHNGKVLDEQIFRKPETIFIGDTAKSHFVIPSSSLPSKFPIFYYKAGRYELVIMGDMTGKVFLKGKVVKIEEVVKKGMLKKRGKAYVLPLSKDARGKVSVGSAIVLFQFIVPPPKPPKLKLPKSIRGSWTQHMDWPFFMTQSILFVIGFSIISYMLTLPAPEPSQLEKVSNRFAKLIAPPEKIKVEEKSDMEEGEGQKQVQNTQAKKEQKQEEAKQETKKEKKQHRSPDDIEKEQRIRREEMKKKVAGKGLLKLIGSKGESGEGGIISDVLSEGGKDRDIDSALAGVKQIGIAKSSADRSRKGDAEGVETVKAKKLKVKKSAGRAKVAQKKEREIKARATMGTTEVDGSVDQNSIKRTVRRHSRAIQRCYERVLKTDPTLKGKIAVSFMINMRGRVEMVEISEDTMNSAKVASCIKGVVKRWRFPKPDGGPAQVTFPFVFSASQ